MEPNNEHLAQPRSVIEVVYAGGTISSLATAGGYREGGHVVDLVGLLEQRRPGFQSRFELGDTAVAYTGLSENLDARYLKDITDNVQDALGRRPNGIVVTHGTDSMEQNARHLQTFFGESLGTSKIILTGANDDISAPNSDAWDNLEFAFESAAGSAEPGVYVAFHGKLIPADLVVKEPFNGSGMNYAASNDPEYMQALELVRHRIGSIVAGLESDTSYPRDTEGIVDYPVNIIRSNHHELIDYINTHAVRAVLLTLYHSGTANTEKPELSVSELARHQKAAKGIMFFAVTENGESVNFGAYETSVKLKEAGIVSLGDMHHEEALARLQLADWSLTSEKLAQAVLQKS